MIGYQDRRFSPAALLKPAFFALVLVYLIFHAFGGNHGIYAYLKEQRKLEVQKIELSALNAQRARMEKRTAMLSDESLDLDMLDERARAVLGMATDKEAVIFLSPEKSEQ